MPIKSSIYAFKPGFQNLLRPVARTPARNGIRANQVTILPCAMSVLAGSDGAQDAVDLASGAAAPHRLLMGVQARWIGCGPADVQHVYFANHMDFALIRTVLPPYLRRKTRPAAAAVTGAAAPVDDT